MAAVLALVIYGASEISVGSMGILAGRGSSMLGVRAISYHVFLKRCKKTIKKGIITRDFEMVNDAVRQFKNFDLKHNTDKLLKMYKLYNLSDEIVGDVRLFNKFYKITVYDYMSIQERQAIVERYITEHELSIIDNERCIDDFFNNTSDNITEEE
jgi:hypothetical protein